MKTKALLLLVLCLHSITMWGNPVDVENARKYAAQSGLLPELSATAHAKSRSGKRNMQQAKSLELVYTLNNNAGKPLLYVFSPESKNGYIIMAADDAVDPVAGYSPGNAFDSAAIAPQFRTFLELMGRYVAKAARKPNRAKAVTTLKTVNREPIGPLLGNICWGQDSPYNNETPYHNGKTPAGCVATALAQIMRYHRFPKRAVGTAYYGFTDMFKQGKAVELGSKGDFLWDKMRESYPQNISYTKEETNAVSRLLLEIGAACNMKYSPSGSGCPGVNALKALHNHFGYTKAQLVKRMNRTAEEWESIIYGELAAKRPVYMDGGSVETAHAFVCDGYDSKGFYHINWGWDGTANGYFNFSYLAPPIYGTGSKDRDVYVVELQAIVGIAPPDKVTDLPAVDEILAKGMVKSDSYNESSPKFDIRSVRLAGYNSIDADFSLGIQKDGEIICVGSSSSWNIAKEIIYKKVNVTLNPNLVPEGTYRLFPIFTPKGKTEWREISVGRYFEHTITVNKIGSNLTVEEKKEPINLESTLEKPFLFSKVNNVMKFSISNKGKAAYSSFVSVCFGQQQQISGNQVEKSLVKRLVIAIHLEPGETREYLAEYKPNDDERSLYASITYDPTNGLSDEDEIIPTTVLSTYHVDVKDLQSYNGGVITQFTQEQYEIHRNKPLEVKIKVASQAQDSENGSFAKLQLFVMDAEGKGVQRRFPEFEVLLEKGEQREFDKEGGELSLEAGNYQLVVTRNKGEGRLKKYEVVAQVPLKILSEESSGGSTTSISDATSDVIKTTAVIEQGMLHIQGDSTVNAIHVYNISGTKVAYAVSASAVDVSHLPDGIYVVRIETSSGIKTIKIVYRH